MKKTMTDAEKSFIERKLSEKDNIFYRIDENNNFVIEHVKNKKWWQKINFFPYIIGFLAVCPFLISGFLIYTVARFDNLLGPGSLKWLSQQNFSPEMIEFIQKSGLSWVNQVLWLYNNEAIIIASIFTFFILLIGIIFLIKNLLKGKNENKENVSINDETINKEDEVVGEENDKNFKEND